MPGLFDLSDPGTQALWRQAVSFLQSSNQGNQVQQKLEDHRRLQQQTIQEIRALRTEIKQPDGQTETVQTLTVADGQATTPAVTTKAPDSSVLYSRYAPDMDVSVGCIPCTRAHLSTIAASLKEADHGHLDQVSAAREEIVALKEYDLTDEKLAVTPERDRAVLAKYRAQLELLDQELKGPAPEATVAAASLKEALRFAREDGVSHPEVQIRVARTEEAINALERVTLAPERMKQMPKEEADRARKMLPELRRARQDLINHLHTSEDLESVTARIAIIDQALNPPPAADKVKEMAKQAQELNRNFRMDALTSFQPYEGVTAS
ncbi:MAG: hypothetical protein OWR52_04070 [Acidibacillus sp.]|nr:hypothetical protein [Acidibacillus sp.]